MNLPDALSTIAEIALGLAGFSGVVVVLGRQPGAFSRVEAGRLVLLLVSSIGAMFLALLPLSLAPLELSDSLLWRVSAGTFTAFCLGYGLIGRSRVRIVRAHAPEIYSLAVSVFNYATVGTAVILQVVVLARPADLGPGFYVLGLLGLLLTATVQFVRMLFVRPQQ